MNHLINADIDRSLYNNVSLMRSVNVIFQPFFPGETHATNTTFKRLGLFMHHSVVPVQIALTMERIVAKLAQKVVALMHTSHMIVQIWLPLEPFVAMIAGVGHGLFVDEQYMIFHAGFCCKTPAASFTDVGPLLLMDHFLVGRQSA